jgi:hypothetical protein
VPPPASQPARHATNPTDALATAIHAGAAWRAPLTGA